LLAEYSVVLVSAGLIIALVVTSLGVPLFALYTYADSIIGLPIP
jgi:hypothetical protein